MLRVYFPYPFSFYCVTTFCPGFGPLISTDLCSFFLNNDDEDDDDDDDDDDDIIIILIIIIL